MQGEEEEVNKIIDVLQGKNDADLQSDDLNKTEENLSAFLSVSNAKTLRRVCTKLGLKATSRRTNWDHKAGYISLLWDYYRARPDGINDASEGSREKTIPPYEGKGTRHCSFRLLNVIFSDEFVDRLGEAGKTLSRHEGNENARYWVDITEAYNNDKQRYNGFALGEAKPQYILIDPALALPHSRSKLKWLWEKVIQRYENALTKAKKAESSDAFWKYCDGHVDALYMDDWLQVREGHQVIVVGLLPQKTHVRLLPKEAHQEARAHLPPVDAGDETSPKRRRLGAIGHSLENTQEDEDEGSGIAERQRVRVERDRLQQVGEEARKGENCVVLDRLSISVQKAMTTLQVLKDGHANQEQINTAELALNKLISSWTQAMTNAATDQQ
ncbi:hypothetical protein P3T76_000664 [Phytophthora citrophthora]|uniref:Uncharacterized protein n=1 Tax=Phytophthora citrophthora TaxID=4793 RepID=A0AAD9H0B5_9STRA|nr:hypothetical protein P3T76_000664 [Phytophthora citrophthora]